MAIALLSQASRDIKYAAAGTIIVWLAFYYLFPAQPLNVADTLVILVLLFLISKALRTLYARLRRPPAERTE